MAHILILHVASSIGKSTLGEAVLKAVEAPFWHMSIDHFRDAGIWRMAHFQKSSSDWSAYRQTYFAGFHAALGAIAAADNNILLEHIFDTPGWADDLRTQFAGQDVFFVGLHTPEDVLSAREAARRDRRIGSACEDAAHIHKGLHYDLELMGTDDPDTNSTRLLRAWSARAAPSAFFQGETS